MRWRVVTDAYQGYEAQIKRWWWPFWVQKDFVNTFRTIEQAEEFAKCSRVVKEGRC